MKENNKNDNSSSNKSFIITSSLLVVVFLLIVGVTVIRYNNQLAKEAMNHQNPKEVNWSEQFPETTTSSVDDLTGVMKYSSPSLLINIQPIEATNLKYWVVNIKARDASKLKSAFAGNKYSMEIKERTSEIAKNNNAIVAIDGSAVGFNTKGRVIREGVIYRDLDFDCAPLMIDKEGDFHIYGYGEKSCKELLSLGAVNTFDFGPDLVKDGKISDYPEWFKENKDPHTVIGQKGKLEYVIIVCDGRSSKSAGMSYYELAEELINQGCYIGYNLDGGGSATLYYGGKVINNPSDMGGERKVSDILYFAN